MKNSLSLRTGATLRPNKIWERFGFFQRLKAAQRQSEQEERRGRGGEDRSSGEDDESDEGDKDGEGDKKEDEGDGTSAEDGGLSWDDVPLPDPMGMLRGLALMFLDINDVSLNYSGDWQASSSNVGSYNEDTTDVDVNYRLLDAVQGDGPSLGYRLGLKRSIDPSDRVLDDRFQVSDVLSNSHRFEGRTTLSPSQSFQIDLSWNVEWRKQTDVTFQGDGDEVNRFPTESGENSASVWGFGSVVSLVKKQANRLPQNTGGGSGKVKPASKVPLTNASVASDFKSAFLTGGGSVGAHGFAPFPMPGWNVRYSGLSDWPLIGRIVKSATLKHSYNAEYRSSYSSNTQAGDTTTVTLGNLGSQQFLNPDFKVGSARVSEQFQPLLGISITWPGNLETSIEWNRQTNTFLRTASLEVEKVQTTQLSGSISYRKQGLRIPVLGLGRLENQIRFSLTLSRSVNDERSYNLRGTLADISKGGSVDASQVTDPTSDYVTVRKQTTRLTVKPELTYRLSNRVTADLRLMYERFNGDNRRPSYTQINGGFNVRVSITQN